MSLNLECNYSTEEGKWKEEELNLLFHSRERSAIFKIPLTLYEEEDFWTWHHTKNGLFTVKSAYFLELTDLHSSEATSSSRNSEVWQRVWKAKVPPKVQQFGWRVLHEAIPVKIKLRQRGMKLDVYCPMCGNSEESIMHCLFLCEEAARIWKVSPLRLDCDKGAGMEFWDWFNVLLVAYKEDWWWTLFWGLLWGVWLRRNKWLFERKKIPIREVLDRSTRCASELEGLGVDKSDKKVQTLNQVVWRAPIEGQYKINSDIAMFGDGNMGFETSFLK